MRSKEVHHVELMGNEIKVVLCPGQFLDGIDLAGLEIDGSGDCAICARGLRGLDRVVSEMVMVRGWGGVQ